MPVVQLSATGTANGSDLLTTLKEEIIPTLESVTGVRDVELVGVTEDVVNIELDNEALATAGLSEQSVMAALDDNGAPMPVGTIQKYDYEHDISEDEANSSN